MAPEHETSLVVEVPCFEDDALYSAEVESLARRVISELSEIRVIDSAKVIEWRHHLLHNAYPVYSLNYKDLVQTIGASMATIENLDLMGRGGFFFYSHLHDQLRFGKDYVHSITQTREGTQFQWI